MDPESSREIIYTNASDIWMRYGERTPLLTSIPADQMYLVSGLSHSLHFFSGEPGPREGRVVAV